MREINEGQAAHRIKEAGADKEQKKLRLKQPGVTVPR
jgi:hypothetical protein